MYSKVSGLLSIQKTFNLCTSFIDDTWLLKYFWKIIKTQPYSVSSISIFCSIKFRALTGCVKKQSSFPAGFKRDILKGNLNFLRSQAKQLGKFWHLLWSPESTWRSHSSLSDRISLCNFTLPATCCVAQVCLRLVEIHLILPLVYRDDRLVPQCQTNILHLI